MKKKWQPLLILTGIALILALGYYGYRKLSQTTRPEIPAISSSEETGESSAADIPSRSQEAESTSEEIKTEAETTKKAAGPAAFDFQVYDEKGSPVRLSEKTGKPVIINFWATWCPPCRAELPGFEKAFQAHHKEIEFMMVDLTDGQSETEDTLAAFLSETGYSFPVYYDKEGSGALAYRVYSIPLTVFINEQGTIVNQHLGSMDEQTLDQYIESLLK